MKNKNLTEQIIGCAYRVYNQLGFGFLESVYENSLLIELNKSGISAVSQSPVKVHYGGYIVGDFIADVVVEGSVILELKSVKSLSKIHEVQLVNYLKATGIHTGLLINFGETGVEIKRKSKVIPGKHSNNLTGATGSAGL